MLLKTGEFWAFLFLLQALFPATMTALCLKEYDIFKWLCVAMLGGTLLLALSLFVNQCVTFI